MAAIYVQIEKLGPPKLCSINKPVCFGNKCQVPIKRGRALQIFLSGDRLQLANELEQLVMALRGQQ